MRCGSRGQTVKGLLPERPNPPGPGQTGLTPPAPLPCEGRGESGWWGDWGRVRPNPPGLGEGAAESPEKPPPQPLPRCDGRGAIGPP